MQASLFVFFLYSKQINVSIYSRKVVAWFVL